MYQAPLSASISRPERREAGENRARVGQQIGVAERAGEVGERPADIGGDDAEQRFRRRREEADVEIAVEEQRRDAGAVQDVLQIVGRAALPLQRLLKLAVEGGELLVERLQLLLRGHQLLVGRLELLVDRHRFFVDRLLLLVGDLEVADGALQLLAGGVELVLELGDPRDDRRVGSTGAASLRSPLGLVDEADQQQLLALALHAAGPRCCTATRTAVVAHLRAGDDRRGRAPRLACRIAALSLLRRPSRAMASRSRLGSPAATRR